MRNSGKRLSANKHSDSRILETANQVLAFPFLVTLLNEFSLAYIQGYKDTMGSPTWTREDFFIHTRKTVKFGFLVSALARCGSFQHGS